MADNSNQNGEKPANTILQNLMHTLDNIVGDEPDLVQAAFRYGLGVILVDLGAITLEESSGNALVIRDSSNDQVTLPRPSLKSIQEQQEQMVQEHLRWLLRYELPQPA